MKRRRCPDPRCGGKLVTVQHPLDMQGAPIVEDRLRYVDHKQRYYQAVRCSKCGANMEIALTQKEFEKEYLNENHDNEEQDLWLSDD